MIMKTSSDINEIVGVLESGGIVAFRTDTLFSLSCDAFNNDAVSKIYSLKQRSVHKALPIFIDSIESAMQYVEIDDTILPIAKKFWPGSLTIILPLLKSSRISSMVHRDFGCIATRIPNASLLRNVIKLYGKPLVGTSANLSGMRDIYTHEELDIYFGTKIDMFADDKDQSSSKVHSTIIKSSGNTVEVLRNGSIPGARILEFI